MSRVNGSSESSLALSTSPPAGASPCANHIAANEFGPNEIPPVARASLRYWVVVTSHFVVDLYPMFIVALVAALQSRLALTETQAALIISCNGVISGLSQPVFAWIGDRLNTRLFGAAGLAAAAIAISSIGFAQHYWQLLALQILGMAGAGVFHPVSSALAGRLGRDTFRSAGSKRSARGMGLAIFFAAGVGAGGFFGPLIATRVNAQRVFDVDGMKLLAFMAIPGALAALAFWIATRRVPHRATSQSSRADTALASVASERQRWFAVGLLFLSNTLRFTVNLSLLYLFKRWAQLQTNEQALLDGAADSVSNLHANVIAAGQVGMGISALVIGRYVGHGRERLAMIVSGLVTAPVVMLMPSIDGGWMLLASAVVAFGYFGVIPTSISLAQRLLPHATGLIGGILMGAGWAISAVGPIIAERVTNAWGIHAAFATVGGLMALAGVVSMFISRRLIRAAASLG